MTVPFPISPRAGVSDGVMLTRHDLYHKLVLLTQNVFESITNALPPCHTRFCLMLGITRKFTAWGIDGLASPHHDQP